MNLLKKISAATAGAVVIIFGTVNNTQAATFTFNTSDSQFDQGIDNQGWWSDTILYNSTDNDNYITGQFPEGGRNFFTFDLSSLSETVTSARLELQQYEGAGSPTETLGLFDVSTHAATLSNNTGSNTAIFNDLGSGTSYGTFEVSTAGDQNEILSFTLNSAAIADISAARGGFFSIGGSLLSLSGTDDQFFFSYSNGSTTQRLVVDTEGSQPVPFEFSPGLGILALGSLGGLNQLKRQVQKRKLSKSAFSIN